MSQPQKQGDLTVTSDHRRQWRSCLYVYPVISRRARGLSVGVNLNPDKRCNFSCVYCQINRRIRRELHEVRLDVLGEELGEALQAVTSGELWREERFCRTSEAMRRINDIALSGDGEPTCLANFDAAVQRVADVKTRLGLDDVKIVLITNASQLDQPQVLRALEILDANNGEIWAKLDAGTEEYFRRTNRPRKGTTLAGIVRNITAAARGRPVVIQSLFLKIKGQPPSEGQVAAYCVRLREILEAGGQIKLVQAHTIARSPASASAGNLADAELDAIAETIRTAVPGVPVETFYGQDMPPQANATSPKNSGR